MPSPQAQRGSQAPRTSSQRAGSSQQRTGSTKPGHARPSKPDEVRMGGTPGKNLPAPGSVQPKPAMSAQEAQFLARRLANSTVVDRMPLYIQASFRRKMLTLLMLQLGTVCGLGLALRHHATDVIAAVFPHKLISVAFGLALMLCIPLLARVRDTYPQNYLAFISWTLATAVFFASAHMPTDTTGWVRSNVLFFAWGLCAVGVFFLMVLCCQSTVERKRKRLTGRKQLRPFGSAGFFAWIMMTVAGSVFYNMNRDAFDSVGMFLAGYILATMLFIWVITDCGLITEKLEPQEYFKSTLYFYTDFVVLCCACTLWAGLVGFVTDT